MKPINFIDQKGENKHKISTSWLIFTLCLTLATAIAIGSFHLNARHKFYKTKEKALNLSQKAATISSIQQDIAELACQKKDIEQSIEKLNKKAKNNEYTLTILNDIAQATPKDLSLTNVCITKNITTLEGSAHHQQPIQNFLDICAQTDWCSRANLEILPTQHNELINFKLILSHTAHRDATHQDVAHKGVHGRY